MKRTDSIHTSVSELIRKWSIPGEVEKLENATFSFRCATFPICMVAFRKVSYISHLSLTYQCRASRGKFSSDTLISPPPSQRHHRRVVLPHSSPFQLRNNTSDKTGNYTLSQVLGTTTTIFATCTNQVSGVVLIFHLPSSGVPFLSDKGNTEPKGGESLLHVFNYTFHYVYLPHFFFAARCQFCSLNS